MDKKFEQIRLNHNPLKDTILNAMEEVRKFIIRKKLILVGGMAIHYLLKLRGKKLYNDDEIPDYDMYSPQNAHDAVELGNLLCSKGYKDVDVITAIHTTTMKVRIDGNVVADITYIPGKIFNNMKYEVYREMKIIHPMYIMFDQFRSFSYPYENPPNEVVYQRWEKNIKRFHLLYEHFPFEEVNVDWPKVASVDLPTNICQNYIITGWAALHHYCEKWEIELPPIPYYSLMTTTLREFITQKSKCYLPYISFPRYIVNGTCEIYDTWGEKVTCNGKYTSLTTLFCWFLNKYFQEFDKVYLKGVNVILSIMQKGYELETECYGDENWNISVLYNIKSLLDYDPKLKPQNMYLTKCDAVCDFTYEKSLLFQIDGSQVKKFIDLVELDDLKIKNIWE